MKNHLLCVLSVAIGLLLGSALLGDTPVDPYAQYRAIGQVRSEVGQGSATLIATRGETALVLCCRHVCNRVGETVKIEWLWAGGQVSQGRVIEIIPGRGFNSDLSLIVCNRPQNVRPVKVVAFDPKAGPWVSAGFRGGQLRYAVADAAMIEGNLIVLNSMFIGGMSGGATFNRYGEQVAVVVASDGRTVGVSTDGALLHGMIDKYRRK